MQNRNVNAPFYFACNENRIGKTERERERMKIKRRMPAKLTVYRAFKFIIFSCLYYPIKWKLFEQKFLRTFVLYSSSRSASNNRKASLSMLAVNDGFEFLANTSMRGFVGAC